MQTNCVVEDHPFDRGYFDRVEGYDPKPRLEATVSDRDQYWLGYREACRELGDDPSDDDVVRQAEFDRRRTARLAGLQ